MIITFWKNVTLAVIKNEVIVNRVFMVSVSIFTREHFRTNIITDLSLHWSLDYFSEEKEFLKTQSIPIRVDNKGYNK